MLDVIAMGEENRTVACTKMNQVSSRSHSVFKLEVMQKLANDSEKRGILNLVDLAGSEKVKHSGQHCISMQFDKVNCLTQFASFSDNFLVFISNLYKSFFFTGFNKVMLWPFLPLQCPHI